jgi:hypothetical protein
MKKVTGKKLMLKKETIAHLNNGQMSELLGGADSTSIWPTEMPPGVVSVPPPSLVVGGPVLVGDPLLPQYGTKTQDPSN